ncbi:agamous-like MADS-box protein AGL75 [Raphanus sativus]|nr:agamous-like MADS-box protein AGL75 [Raphanus sativus]
MPYGGGYYDQNMFVGNNYQDPCVSSNTQDYSVFPLELQESLSNYGLNQLMPQELYGLDQNMCMGDTININNNAQDPCLSDDFCFDFQDPYSGFMVDCFRHLLYHLSTSNLPNDNSEIPSNIPDMRS